MQKFGIYSFDGLVLFNDISIRPEKDSQTNVLFCLCLKCYENSVRHMVNNKSYHALIEMQKNLNIFYTNESEGNLNKNLLQECLTDTVYKFVLVISIMSFLQYF